MFLLIVSGHTASPCPPTWSEHSAPAPTKKGDTDNVEFSIQQQIQGSSHRSFDNFERF